jgi:hypothetical protein
MHQSFSDDLHRAAEKLDAVERQVGRMGASVRSALAVVSYRRTHWVIMTHFKPVFEATYSCISILLLIDYD